MADSRFVGQNIFGTQSTSRSKTRYAPWRYLVALLVVVVAGLYALPNLFPPDYAIQIQTDNKKNSVGDPFNIGSGFIGQVVELVENNDVSVKAHEQLENGALFRFNSEIDRDRAKLFLEERLNPEGLDRQFIVALSLADTTPKWLQRIGGRPMTLGLDLAGGIHFVLQVDMDTSIKNQLSDEAEKVLDQLRAARIRYVTGQDIVTGQTLTIEFADEEIRDRAMSTLREHYGLPDYELTSTRTAENPAIQFSLTSARLREMEDLAIEQNLEGIRNRVNELNVSEPLVQRLGRNRIVVDLPGVQDSSEAKRILDKFATLEFRLTAKPDDRPSEIESFPYEGRMETIQKEIIIEGKSVINAMEGRDEHGIPQVNITLDRAGGDRMHDVTKDNVNHHMAILFIEQKPIVTSEIVDGVRVETTRIEEERELISVARITTALGYKSRITHLDSMREAKLLALLLRAGALAAPMYFVEERTVGASLGEENIQRGFTAVVIGFLLVLAFMLVYYKVFGFVANIALTLNLIIVIAVMSSIGATLTLPGIAGMVLTVGMAVDANVLIFSRIREELKVSKPWAAIPAGYDRAFRTILDANLTTLFVALILLFLGSGPIAGFAVTLSIGIVTSMFTAIFVSRGIVHLIYGRPNVEKVWI
ncbi:MAG: protein translocase subunit SecD [Gammaproteobacteria bacterium]|nr:protein translocase subunit SecD [Gammaproteobacteria bacterium]MYF01426.1 protein translocase subunit SecD [Gammaproteobacteria bacterium]MYI76218.1 protein translocase subunit SecD [Gammaproteobacteria bacterium]